MEQHLGGLADRWPKGSSFGNHAFGAAWSLYESPVVLKDAKSGDAGREKAAQACASGFLVVKASCLISRPENHNLFGCPEPKDGPVWPIYLKWFMK